MPLPAEACDNVLTRPQGDIVSLMMIGTYGAFNKKSLLGLYVHGAVCHWPV
jgi:hypothetical protein